MSHTTAEETPAKLLGMLSESERKNGFTRPVRTHYRHLTCSAVMRISQPVAESLARSPKLCRSMFCRNCENQRPVDEFVWDGTDAIVGS